MSILSNIAEGFESRTYRLLTEYMGRAKASAGELRAQVYVANDIQYLDQHEFAKLFELGDKCSRQISRLQ